MSAVKDKKTGKWIARFYFTDVKGEKNQHFKRGFSTKREALEYEREFLSKSSLTVDMTFQSLYELYLEDISVRLRKHTIISKQYMIELKILPFFKKMKLSKITPIVIRKWQNDLLNLKNPFSGKKYSQTYIKTINNQLVAIFNYAVKYHNLKENPCHKAGSIGKKNADEMQIWSVEEFEDFINLLKKKPLSYAGFQTLFWTGLRIGELLALTREDINLEKKTLRVNKSYQRINGQDVITDPKTPKSKRIIDIPDNLTIMLSEYIKKIYDCDNKTRLFPATKSIFEHDMITYSKKANVKKIRIHDLRHSHASFLINNNVNILAIANRLGHEKIETTLNTYSHLYEESRNHMLNILNSRCS